MRNKWERITAGAVARTYVLTALFNSGIALLLTWIGFGDDFGVNFIVSQCIGLSICTSVLGLRAWFKPERVRSQVGLVAMAILFGSLLGSALGSMLSGEAFAFFSEDLGLVFQVVVLGLVFGSIISYFFYSRERIFATESLLQEEQIKRLSQENQILEADLKLLQAQVEPHFLFNTLSQVLSLIELDPERAREMLEDFISYLRSSLLLTRQAWISIGQEVELIQAYLNLLRIRMGERLDFRIELEDGLQERNVPPLLIQPLVENAIKHGLEPKVEGGRITVNIAQNRHILRITVQDTGLGLHGAQGKGTGLSTISDRLYSLYGDRAGLLLETNQPTGLKAVLELPLEDRPVAALEDKKGSRP